VQAILLEVIPIMTRGVFMSSLEELLLQEQQKLKLAFEEASTKYTTADDIALHREEAVRKFLRRFFPPAYQIGKGEILDSVGKRSTQIDIVICTPYHPFTISESGTGLFFCEGIACAVEVKSDLSSKVELERGLRQIWSVKQLERKPLKGDMMFGSKYAQERLRRIPAVLFGYRSPSLVTLKTNIMEIHAKLGVSNEEQVDAVVVLEKGVIYNVKDPRDNIVIMDSKERRLGLVGLVGDEVLMRFLFCLSAIVPHEIRMLPITLLYAGAFEKRGVKII